MTSIEYDLTCPDTADFFIVPEDIEAPWFTLEYIRKNAWYPVIDGDKAEFVNTRFGTIPCKTREEYMHGDIIIYNEFYAFVDKNGEYYTDRFERITIDDVLEMRNGERELLPVGVVVHAPSNF